MAFFTKEISPELISGLKNCFLFKDKDILVHHDLSLPTADEFISFKNNDFLMNLILDSSTSSAGAELLNSSEELCSNLKLQQIPLRQYFYEKTEEEAALSARMKSLTDWISVTKYCSACGAELTVHNKESALYCPSCKKIHFPRIEPCIIVLIHNEDKILLLRHSYRNQNMYTCLAGFIEVGESVEQAVIREVKEEVGLEIQNLRYAGSQGWPFPDQLMLAFHADYKKGQLKLQEDEILEARWLKLNEVENIPRPGSVAWKLIHDCF